MKILLFLFSIIITFSLITCTKDNSPTIPSIPELKKDSLIFRISLNEVKNDSISTSNGTEITIEFLDSNYTIFTSDSGLAQLIVNVDSIPSKAIVANIIVDKQNYKLLDTTVTVLFSSNSNIFTCDLNLYEKHVTQLIHFNLNLSEENNNSVIPSVNADVSFNISDSNYAFHTDQSGIAQLIYSFDPDSLDTIKIRINVNKKTYFTIDTTINITSNQLQISNTIDCNLTLQYKSYYFPLVVGHKTKYNARSYYSDQYNGRDLFSTEDWEITEVDSNYSFLKMLITTHYYMKIVRNDPSIDTTYLDETYQNEYTINISEDGRLSNQNCPSDKSYICHCIRDCINESNPIKIYQKNSKDSKLLIRFGWADYELTKGYGISYLNTYSLGPSAAVGHEYKRIN